MVEDHIDLVQASLTRSMALSQPLLDPVPKSTICLLVRALRSGRCEHICNDCNFGELWNVVFDGKVDVISSTREPPDGDIVAMKIFRPFGDNLVSFVKEATVMTEGLKKG